MTETGSKNQRDENDIHSRIYIAFSDLRNSQLYQQVRNYARAYPMLAVAALTIGFLSFVPVLTFTFFVLATFIVYLLLFLFVEGTLLTVAVVILSGTLFTIGIFAAAFTVCVAIVWFIVRKIHVVLCSRQELFCFSKNFNTNEAEEPILNCDSSNNVNGCQL